MKKTFLRKLATAFITLAVLYTLIAGGVHLYKNAEIMKVQLDNQRRAFTEQNQTRLDMKLNVALNYVNQLRGNQYVLEYALNPAANNFAMTQVFKELKGNLNAFTNLGYQIDLVALHDDTVIMPQNTLSRSYYYQGLGFSAEEIEHLEELERSGAWSKVYLAHTPYPSDRAPEIEERLVFARKESLANGGELMFLISFYKNMLLPQLKGQEDFGILFQERVWVDGAMDRKRLAVPDLLAAAEVTADSTGYSKFPLDSRSIHMVRSTTLDNIAYVYLATEVSLGQSLWPLVRNTAMVYAGMALLGAGLAFFMANRMYRPVRRITAIFTDYSDGKGTDEFSFIQNTASEIRETNNTLRETISHHKLSMKSKFLRDLLFGILTMEQAQQGLVRYGLEWLGQESTVVLFDFPEEKDWENEYSLEAILQIKSRTMEMIRGQIKELMLCEGVEVDQSRYAILIPEVRLEPIKRMLVAAVAEVEAEFAISIAAAVGPPACHAHQLKNSYKPAWRLLEQRLVWHKQSVLTYEDLARMQKLDYYYPLEMEREMIIHILQGNAGQATELLDHVLEENLGAGRLNENALPFFLYAFLSTINRALQQMSRTESEVFAGEQSVRDMLLSGRTEEETRRRLYALVGRLVEAAGQKNRDMDRSVVHQMIDYMHAHYQKDIGLADLAEHFNLSSNYISFLIKEHIGDNFKDYLNEYRVRQAKRIISETPDIKVNDLAGMVGCNNANTFIRIFKKYEGVSPGQYLKQHQ